MNLSILWPDFLESCILHETPDLIFVNKPVYMPAQSVHAEGTEDLFSRLKSYLARREGHDVYLGSHQRLDANTSGVVMYTKTKEVNAHVAKSFEERSVKKIYLACVKGRIDHFKSKDEKKKNEKRLVHLVQKIKDGRMGVVPSQGAGLRAARAESIVRPLKFFKDKALLSLELVTGRMHQARVQLAYEGFPVAGDTLYGGPPAQRLLLHSHELRVIDPRSFKPISVLAPMPREFDAWLKDEGQNEYVYDAYEDLIAVLERAMQRRYALAHNKGLNAFRLVNEGGDALLGLAVDVYDGYLVAQFYENKNEAIWSGELGKQRRERVLDSLMTLGFRGVYVKIRPRQANDLVDTRVESLAPKNALRGETAPFCFEIKENNLPYLVRLGDGLSTGLFLDQRKNREYVKQNSANKRVLNLFAYQCAFTVSAAAGLALEITSVDISSLALERGIETMKHAGFDGDRYHYVAEDVFFWLNKAQKKGLRYDLILIDPPSYSTTKKNRFVASKDYVNLAVQCFKILEKGGEVIACCNHRHLSRAVFRKMIAKAAHLAQVNLKQLKDLSEPVDYPPAHGCEVHLKSVLARAI